MRRFAVRSLMLALAIVGAHAHAGSVRIDAVGCDPDVIHADDFDSAVCSYEADASGGSGADATAGDHSDTVLVGQRLVDFAYRVPANYDPSVPAPLLVALHPSTTNPVLSASTVRTYWSATAALGGAIVLTPYGTYTTSSGGTTIHGWRTADAATVAATVAWIESRYNVDRRRRYLWGYSAGAHFGHGVVLDDAPSWAAYAVSAGALTQYACFPSSSAGSFYCPNYLAGVDHRLPVAIYIGRSDPLYLPPYDAAGDPARLLEAGWNPAELRYVEFSGGHTYAIAHLAEMWAFMSQYARPR
jgi:predicted esterase